MPWTQSYDPFGNATLSTIVAALPVFALLGLLATHRVRAEIAAILALLTAIVVAIVAVGMPTGLALRSAGLGVAYGLFPIGWIILNVIFLYQVAEGRNSFAVLRSLVAGITGDRRLQLLLIAFCLGAFFEGAAGFGTPVAVTAVLLMGLGFSPLQAAGLSLIANTAPVAFGALGTPIIALQGVTGLDLHALSSMVGRQLPVFSIIVPIWLVWAYGGLRAVRELWPALLVTGASFAIPQYLMSNYHGPWLVDIVASVCSIGALVVFLKVWRRSGVIAGVADSTGGNSALSAESMMPASLASPHVRYSRSEIRAAVLPWIILTLLVFLWGIPQIKALLNGISAPRYAVTGLHEMILRGPPVATTTIPEAAVFTLNWLSATGSAIFVTAIISGFLLGYSLRELVVLYRRTIVRVHRSLVTIAAMLALGFVSRYSGLDAILGLAFARTGFLYPFFGTMLGWLGVALTGSDTSSNVLFGNLQTITAQQVGVSPTLMAAANSSGGVMGKMIDVQSIVVASTATQWYGHEGKILRYVFWHSVVLAMLVGAWVMLQAYVWPFTAMVVQ